MSINFLKKVNNNKVHTETSYIVSHSNRFTDDSSRLICLRTYANILNLY